MQVLEKKNKKKHIERIFSKHFPKIISFLIMENKKNLHLFSLNRNFLKQKQNPY